MSAGAAVHAGDTATADREGVRVLFLRQVEAENAHDIAKLDGVLADSPDDGSSPVSFVARAYEFWGKKAVMQHFEQTFKGTWRLDPDMSRARVVPLGADTTQIYVPTKVTLGAPGQAPVTATYLINEFAVRTARGWRFTAILPLPAQ
ncbi:DUF4440 domain-containing protein [Bordetella genomosp. 8]|uniref:DUF4440 domain-containing protein n=2 Tax=Bordetella genomosp. 8 TaxID=1416806 RepID=A0A1W6YU87_9BORD|nr:DUF4440 domain-containing protein [Bordetella genomosp. 8]